MSHVSQINRKELFDLQDIKKACEIMKFPFMENQKSFAYYYNQTEPCDHAVKVGDCEIGFRKSTDGMYSMHWDPYKLERVLGKNAGLFTQTYDVVRASRVARAHRRRCIELTKDQVSDAKPGWRYLKVYSTR